MSKSRNQKRHPQSKPLFRNSELVAIIWPSSVSPISDHRLDQLFLDLRSTCSEIVIAITGPADELQTAITTLIPYVDLGARVVPFEETDILERIIADKHILVISFDDAIDRLPFEADQTVLSLEEALKPVPGDLIDRFPAIRGAGRGCATPGCTHISEAGCEVWHQVNQGRIDRGEYGLFIRLSVGSQSQDQPRDTFICANCGEKVDLYNAGSEHRNHCPICLHSVHLDVRPGDRQAKCRATMQPIAVWVREDGEWAIIHRCAKCGTLSSNRIAADDDEEALMAIAKRPIENPPFPD